MPIIFTEHLNTTLSTLLSGECEEAFGQELGFSHFNNYGFEDSAMPWQAWNSPTPLQTNEDAFCGHHALYVCCHKMAVY